MPFLEPVQQEYAEHRECRERIDPWGRPPRDPAQKFVRANQLNFVGTQFHDSACDRKHHSGDWVCG